MRILIYVNKYDLEDLKSYEHGSHTISYSEQPSYDMIGVLIDYDIYIMLEDGKGL